MVGPKGPSISKQRLAIEMARPSGKTVKIMSYNSTGLNSVKAQWIRDLLVTFNVSFLGLQEHFKRGKSLPQLFKREFGNYDASICPAYREDCRDTGRAKGGLAQLCLKSLNGVERELVVTTGWRIQAQILRFGGWRLLWVNVYFPSDPQILNFDESELLVVQDELKTILDKGGYDGCICAGDWNYDARRRSGFARSMFTFLEEVGLVSVWEKFSVDFTYMHTDHKSTSILDNFYVNESLLPFIEEAQPVHLGDNSSGHSPIVLTLQVKNIPEKTVEEGVRMPRQLAWGKAEDEELRRYRENLQERLEALQHPDTLECTDVECKNHLHTEDRDRYVLDLISSWVEASYSSIPLKPAPRPVKVGAKQKHAQLPGWNEKCEPLCSAAKFWYSVWLSAGKPQKGELHRLMVSTRVKFRAAVRRARSEANSAKAHMLLSAAESGDRALLKEMRRVVGSSKLEQQVPDSLEGAHGDGAVLDKFKSLYEALYNSAATEGKMGELLRRMNEMLDCRAEGEVSRVTAKVVAAACRRMKPGKIDVTGSYGSDVFCNAPPLLCQELAAVFRSFLIHGNITLSILSCSFMPLLKSARKDPTKFDSWRAVAGASQLLKLFEYTLLEVWGGHLESDSLQFGFKAGTGTDQCTWLLHSVAEYYLLRGSPTLCCLLDVRKGFPSVRFGDLFEICLVKKKLPAIVCRVLAFMYQEQSGFVKLRGRRSPAFSLSNGMREGAACSPCLWAVYADGLLLVLRKSRLGCQVAGQWMGAFLYADDLSLIAPTRVILASMLAIVAEYGASLNLYFSTCQDPGKCKSFCIYFAGPARKVVYPAPLVLNGVTLPWKEKAVHLGHILQQDLTFDADAAARRAAFISRSVDVREQFSFAPPAQVLKAVRILCCHGYGAVLWQLNSTSATSYFKAYNSCIKRVFRLPLNTYTYLVEGHLNTGAPLLRNMVLSRYPTFFQNLMRSPSVEVSLMAEMVAKDARTTSAGNLAFLAKLTGLDCMVADKMQVKSMLPVEVVPENERWRLGLLDALLLERSSIEKEAGDTKRVIALISSLCST